MAAICIRPYRVCSSSKSLEELFAELNAMMYAQHSPDYRYGSGRIIVSPLKAYDDLLFGLSSIGNVEFVTYRKLFSRPRPENRIQVLFRHDVDCDLPAALRMAEVEEGYDISTTYFFLHTAHYHGVFQDGIFTRYECVGHIYNLIQDLGHEVGLHNDALTVYRDRCVDGAEALRVELEWMRSIGLQVEGTAEHGSFPCYGARAFEIFKERTWTRIFEPFYKGDFRNDLEVMYGGKWAPLKVLNEADLGLTYEALDAHSYEQSVKYGAIKSLNTWFWLSAEHLLKRRQSKNLQKDYFVDQDRLLEAIEGLPHGTLVILNVHPCYYGCRHSTDSGPCLHYEKVEHSIGDWLGWQTYAPKKTQCFSVMNDSRRRQSIQFSNELGMLDRSTEKSLQVSRFRILLMGGDNINASRVGVDAQAHSLLEAHLNHYLDQDVTVRKLAFPGMGVSRLWSWYEATKETLDPNLVILGIGGSVLQRNLPLVWSRETGFSLSHPPGEYLTYDRSHDTVKTVARSANWAIHQMKPQKTFAWSQSGQDLVEPLALGSSFQVDGLDCLEWIERIYEWVLSRIRSEGRETLLLIEELGTLTDGQGNRLPVRGDTTAGRAIRKRLIRMAEGLGVEIVDPYSNFAESPQTLPPEDADGAWNFTGHRLAAESIFRVLKSSILCNQTLS